MATTPAFVATPRIGVGAVTTANTGRDGTGTLVDIITGAATGTRINQISAVATGDLADSILTLFLYDGTTNWYWDSIDVGDPTAGSTTVDPSRTDKAYTNLVLPNTSWKLRAAITVAPTSGQVNVFALGGDL